MCCEKRYVLVPGILKIIVRYILEMFDESENNTSLVASENYERPFHSPETYRLMDTNREHEIEIDVDMTENNDDDRELFVYPFVVPCGYEGGDEYDWEDFENTDADDDSTSKSVLREENQKLIQECFSFPKQEIVLDRKFIEAGFGDSYPYHGDSWGWFKHLEQLCDKQFVMARIYLEQFEKFSHFVEEFRFIIGPEYMKKVIVESIKEACFGDRWFHRVECYCRFGRKCLLSSMICEERRFRDEGTIEIANNCCSVTGQYLSLPTKYGKEYDRNKLYVKQYKDYCENILKLEVQIEEVINSDICSRHEETYHLGEITWALVEGRLTDVGILLDHFWNKYYDSGFRLLEYEWYTYQWNYKPFATEYLSKSARVKGSYRRMFPYGSSYESRYE